MCFTRKPPNIHVYLYYIGNYLDSLPTKQSEMDVLTDADRKIMLKKNISCQKILTKLHRFFDVPRELYCGPVPSGGVTDPTPRPPKEIRGIELPNIHVYLRYIGLFIEDITGFLQINPGITDWKDFNKRLGKCKDALNICHNIFALPLKPYRCGTLAIEQTGPRLPRK